MLLEAILSSESAREIDNHELLPAYVASVCSAIEFRLNEAYIRHFHRLLGEGYEPYAAPYLRLRIEDKLGLLIPLISNFKYELNRKAEKVKFLFKLFRLRNRLVHQLPHLVTAEFEWLDEGRGRLYYPEAEYRYAHSHPEWESVKARDLRAIHRSLDFWMMRLSAIADRIRYKRFNPEGVFVTIQTSNRK